MPTARKPAAKTAKKTAPKKAEPKKAAPPRTPSVSERAASKAAPARRPASKPAAASTRPVTLAPKCTAPDVLAELKSRATEPTLKAFRAQGVIDPVFGVPTNEIEAVARHINTDHPLACALWETRNFDAQSLATHIADPNSLTPGQLDRWSRSVSSAPITDALAGIAARTKHARECVRKWTSSPGEYIRRAGYATLAVLLGQGEDFDDSYLNDTLARIEKEIHASPPRARESMNAALVSIGSARKSMHAPALAAAKRVGKVGLDFADAKEVDAAKELQKPRRK